MLFQEWGKCLELDESEIVKRCEELADDAGEEEDNELKKD